MSKSLAYSVAAVAAFAGLTFGVFMIPKNDSAVAESKAAGFTKAEIQDIVKEYILDNPEVLMQSVNDYQSKRARQQQEDAQKLLPEVIPQIKSANFPSIGKKDASVTVIEFFDYNCGYCKRALPTIEKVMAEDKDVRIIFQELPILSPQSQTAARAALAVHLINPDKYFPFHAKLMKIGARDEASILKAAEEVGLNKADVQAKMKDKAVDELLSKTQEYAQKMGVGGTPSFVVGNQFVPGAIDTETMLRMIKAEREKK